MTLQKKLLQDWIVPGIKKWSLQTGNFKQVSPAPYCWGGAGEDNYVMRKNITGGEICFANT